MERKKYLDVKFNGTKNAAEVYKNIYKSGIDNEIHFQFDKIEKTPNTFASHKLLALAYKFNKQTEIVSALFYDYFIEGIDIGSIDELLRIAKQHNIYDESTKHYINSNKDNTNLLAEEKYARKLGITGVPAFIVNKETVLFGVQDKKVFKDVFLKYL